ncbi:MAG: DNA repair protein RecO [Gemmatimonas sp.]|nr:DNA repair protein RecO [Gemmatimonas sp.]
MPLVETPALILHVFPYGDTSRILRLLTPGFGFRSVIAKGAQRPRSRFGGILEPFTEGSALFNLREGRDLFSLSSFTLLKPRQGIGRDLGAFAGASLLAELGLRAGTEEPNPQLYAVMTRTLDTLADPDNSPVFVALAAVWHVVSILGFQPEVETCVRCGRPFDSTEPSRFDVEAGGSVCRTCRPAGRLIDPSTRLELLAMASKGEPCGPAVNRALHGALLHTFLSTHLASDRPLRALPLFLEQLR